MLLILARTVIHGSETHGAHYHILLSDSSGSLQSYSVALGRLVKLLLTFDSTVIPGFSLLKMHDQHFYSLLDRYVFGNVDSSLMKERLVFVCRHYICCTVVSARAYLRCHCI
jgi:hypothetical protein